MGVFEKHGVLSQDEIKAAAIVNEQEGAVALTITSGVNVVLMNLTPEEARYIASKLRRVAKRVEDRNGEG